LKLNNCLNCFHIKGIHDPECRYVHYIEDVGASVCKCHEFKDKKDKKENE